VEGRSRRGGADAADRLPEIEPFRLKALTNLGQQNRQGLAGYG
jgi:hypothetical protein